MFEKMIIGPQLSKLPCLYDIRRVESKLSPLSVAGRPRVTSVGELNVVGISLSRDPPSPQRPASRDSTSEKSEKSPYIIAACAELDHSVTNRATTQIRATLSVRLYRDRVDFEAPTRDKSMRPLLSQYYNGIVRISVRAPSRPICKRHQSYCPMSWIGGACSGGFPRLIVS
jgi:hypothetical protein